MKASTLFGGRTRGLLKGAQICKAVGINKVVVQETVSSYLKTCKIWGLNIGISCACQKDSKVLGSFQECRVCFCSRRLIKQQTTLQKWSSTPHLELLPLGPNGLHPLNHRTAVESAVSDAVSYPAQSSTTENCWSHLQQYVEIIVVLVFENVVKYE